MPGDINIMYPLDKIMQSSLSDYDFLNHRYREDTAVQIVGTFVSNRVVLASDTSTKRAPPYSAGTLPSPSWADVRLWIIPSRYLNDTVPAAVLKSFGVLEKTLTSRKSLREGVRMAQIRKSYSRISWTKPWRCTQQRESQVNRERFLWDAFCGESTSFRGVRVFKCS